jgi:hypothetical protein
MFAFETSPTSPRCRKCFMKKILALLLLVPSALSAQTRTMVSGYLAADPSVAGNPLLVGATAARETGPLAARLSLGFDVSTAPVVMDESLTPVVSGIWSSDADALLFLGNPRGTAALVPYGIVGAGIRGIAEDGSLGIEPSYSYGAGFRSPLGAGFSMEGEARYRDYLSKPAEDAAPRVKSGMEFRFGVSVGFGGGPRLRVPASTSPTRPTGPARPASIPAGLVPNRGLLTSMDSRVRVAAATLNTASNYLGVPYVWGGNTPEGFDCSGFIRYVFDLNGIAVPRVSQDQARFGAPVPLDISQFQPGDILAFSSTNGEVDHTALYVGNGQIIHSSSSGSGVRYDDLYSSRGEWFRDHMVAARRVIDSGSIYLSGR